MRTGASPQSGRLYLYDTAAPGLAFCLTAAGARTFYVYRKVHGRPERIRLGTLADLTVAQARSAVRVIVGEIAEGKNPAQARRATRLEPTLGDLWQHLVDTHRPKLSAKTMEGYRAQWKGHLKPWAGRRLSAVTQGDVAKMHARIGRKAPYLANRVLALLGSMYAKAPQIGWNGDSPAKGINASRSGSGSGSSKAMNLAGSSRPWPMSPARR